MPTDAAHFERLLEQTTELLVRQANLLQRQAETLAEALAALVRSEVQADRLLRMVEGLLAHAGATGDRDTT
jgi:hypothetical protein